jgi:hypothetical protein
MEKKIKVEEKCEEPGNHTKRRHSLLANLRTPES